MKGKPIYDECPTYTTDHFLLRPVEVGDAEDLLRCYSDEAAVRLMNADNCNTDFHFETLEAMRDYITGWVEDLKRSLLIRFSVVDSRSGTAVGTIEMFDKNKSIGVLRLDLCSAYETQDYIVELLGVSVENFYDGFGVTHLVSKAIPEAAERIAALRACGFTPAEREVNGPYGDYYERERSGAGTLIGACGMRCRGCAAYKATQTTDPEELKALAEIESQYLGVEIEPEENGCDGCMTVGGRKGPCVPRCKVRPCAERRGYRTCAECDQFACELLTAL